jgi:aryl-alcohol dehydrogenase-like predicted oxidoreductase
MAIRFVGVTGHKDPSIHLNMLSHGFRFDTVQMPLNCFDATFRSFEQQVLPEAARQGIAALGMKSMGGSGEMVRHGGVTAAEAHTRRMAQRTLGNRILLMILRARYSYLSAIIGSTRTARRAGR